MEKTQILPQHIAFIIDGNRRWAKERGKPSFFGHKKGMDNVKKILDLCLKKGIKFVSVYAFSTENWKREKNEVDYLMRLFYLFAKQNLKELKEKGIRLKVIGQFERLPKRLQNILKKAIDDTKNNSKMVFQIALSYGGRVELIEAIKKIVKKGIKTIDESTVTENLYTAGIPDPDYIIRTSGEQRLSNFMTWQSVYSEFYFPKVHWPGFNKEWLEKALKIFSNRQRRYGK